MGIQAWIVKSGGGNEWGLIRRLVINSGTRQINYADVFVIHSGQIVRFPWDNFEIGSEGITLGMPDAQVAAKGIGASEGAEGEAVSMDVWP